MNPVEMRRWASLIGLAIAAPLLGQLGNAAKFGAQGWHVVRVNNDVRGRRTLAQRVRQIVDADTD
jgi:hypothetical protein